MTFLQFFAILFPCTHRKSAANTKDRITDTFLALTEQKAVNTALLTAEVKKSLGAKPVPPAVQYAIKVYCAGTVRAIFDWLMNGMPTPAEELAQILEDCLPPILRGFLCG